MKRKDIDIIYENIEEIFDWLEELSYEIYKLKRGRGVSNSQNTNRLGTAMSFIEEIYGRDIKFDGSESGIKMIPWNLDVSLEEFMDSVEEDCDCEVHDEQSHTDKWELDAHNTYIELKNILIKKQKDYGPDNIRKAPGGAYAGLSVRLHDKIARLENLLSTGATPENESLRDTFIDIANYGVIGVMLMDDTFPKSKDA